MEIVKGYSKHEEQVFTKIAELRTPNYDSKSINDKIALNQGFSGIIGSLNLTVENYPELKANEEYRRLSENLVIIEDEIALSRKYYNGTIRDYQRFTKIFPNNLFAKFLKSPDFLLDTVYMFFFSLFLTFATYFKLILSFPFPFLISSLLLHLIILIIKIHYLNLLLFCYWKDIYLWYN